jgi:hypothetical protein
MNSMKKKKKTLEKRMTEAGTIMFLSVFVGVRQWLKLFSNNRAQLLEGIESL